VVKFVFALHLLFAIFAIGPLVHAAKTAARGVRRPDAELTAASARLLRIYSYASVLVVLAGLGLMSMNDPDEKGQKIGEFSQTWIWLSLVLWLAAMGVVHALLVPDLKKATERITAEQPIATLNGRLTIAGSLIGVIFTVIVFLMVYQPGH
jgi:hypothetical protein